jgi:hypothetical protein
MPNVVPTSLTTDSPGSGELNLFDGFAMFPWLGAIRAGADLGSASGTWCQKVVNFEFIKLSCGIYHSTFIGICGPSYAVDLDTDASTSYTVPAPGQPSSGTLVALDQDLRGGFQYGIDFQIDFDVEVDLNLVVTKKKLVDIDANIDIDVIELVKDLIIYLLSGGGGGQAEGDPNEYEMSTFSSDSSGSVEQMSIEEGTNGTGGPSGKPASGGVSPEFSGAGMVDYIANPWTQPPNQTFNGPPSNTLQPQLGLDFSIVPLFAEIPFLDVLYGFDEALQPIGGSFDLGPGLAVGLPTTVTLTGATVDNHPFNIASATTDSSGKTSMPMTEQTPISPNLQPLKETPDEIGLLLTHEVGFSIGLYFFIGITVLKVFHIGATTGTLPLITTAIPGGAGGPFTEQLSFIPGGGEVPFDAPTDAPTVGSYTQNQPQGSWQNGVLARYGYSFFSSEYESPIGPFTAYDAQQRFFAMPQLSDIEAGPLVGDGAQISGRNIYRQFNDGSEVELVGTINDNVTTTFTDTTP